MLCPLVYKKICQKNDSSEIRIQKNLVQKDLETKFGSKNIWVQKYFKIFGNLKSWVKNFLVQLNFGCKKNVAPKKNRSKNFGSRMIWVLRSWAQKVFH